MTLSVQDICMCHHPPASLYLSHRAYIRLVASSHTLTCPGIYLLSHSMTSAARLLCALCLESGRGSCAVTAIAAAGALLSQQRVPAAYLLVALCLEGGVGLVMALSHLILHVGNLGLQCEGCTIVYELPFYHLRGKGGQSLAMRS